MPNTTNAIVNVLASQQTVPGLIVDGLSVVFNSTRNINITMLATECLGKAASFAISPETLFKTICSTAQGTVETISSSAGYIPPPVNEGLNCVLNAVCGTTVSYAALATLGGLLAGTAAGAGIYALCRSRAGFFTSKPAEENENSGLGDVQMASYGTVV